jgi:hypothetical protein
MDLAAVVTVLTNIGLGAAAWRLANALRVRVDDHEKRLGVLETVRA